MYDITKLISQEQFDQLLLLLPTPRQMEQGRPRCKKEPLINGILQVLINDIPWKKIADCGCSPSSCHRYFQELQRRGDLKLIFRILSKQKTNIMECAIDTDSTTSFRFRNGTGWDGKHKKISTKISLLSDVNGLPADVEIDKGNKHDLRFVQIILKTLLGQEGEPLMQTRYILQQI